MHHYGKMKVKVKFGEQEGKDTFNIILTNHLTGAEITVTGPTKGVFEKKEHILDHATAEKLGLEIAHTLKHMLTKVKGF